MGFSRISNFQINVSISIFLVSSTFQSIMNDLSSFHSQKNIHEKTDSFLTDFSWATLLIVPLIIFFIQIGSTSKSNGSNFKRILIRPTIKNVA